MGLLLSILVVCVGVLEAVSCFRHIQHGYLPFWMPRRHPALPERRRRKPSDGSSSSDEELSRLMTNDVMLSPTRAEPHYGLTPILAEHRRNTPILRDDEDDVGGDEGAEDKYVANNVDDCLVDRCDGNRSLEVIERFRPISPTDTRQDGASELCETSDALGQTRDSAETDEHCDSEVALSGDLDDDLDVVSEVQPPVVDALLEPLELLEPLDSIATLEPEPVDALFAENKPATNQEITATQETNEDTPATRETNETTSHVDTVTTSDQNENTGPVKRPNPAPLNPLNLPLDLHHAQPIDGPLSRPSTPSTPRKVRADISWPVFHPDEPVIKRPCTELGKALRLSLSQDDSIDEDLLDADLEGVESETEAPSQEQDVKYQLEASPPERAMEPHVKPTLDMFLESLDRLDSSLEANDVGDAVESLEVGFAVDEDGGTNTSSERPDFDMLLDGLDAIAEVSPNASLHSGLDNDAKQQNSEPFHLDSLLTSTSSHIPTVPEIPDRPASPKVLTLDSVIRIVDDHFSKIVVEEPIELSTPFVDIQAIPPSHSTTLTKEVETPRGRAMVDGFGRIVGIETDEEIARRLEAMIVPRDVETARDVERAFDKKVASDTERLVSLKDIFEPECRKVTAFCVADAQGTLPAKPSEEGENSSKQAIEEDSCEVKKDSFSKLDVDETPETPETSGRLEFVQETIESANQVDVPVYEAETTATKITGSEVHQSPPSPITLNDFDLSNDVTKSFDDVVVQETDAVLEPIANVDKQTNENASEFEPSVVIASQFDNETEFLPTLASDTSVETLASSTLAQDNHASKTLESFPSSAIHPLTTDSSVRVDAISLATQPSIEVEKVDDDDMREAPESLALGKDITSKESSIKRRKSYKKRSPRTSTESLGGDDHVQSKERRRELTASREEAMMEEEAAYESHEAHKSRETQFGDTLQESTSGKSGKLFELSPRDEVKLEYTSPEVQDDSQEDLARRNSPQSEPFSVHDDSTSSFYQQTLARSDEEIRSHHEAKPIPEAMPEKIGRVEESSEKKGDESLELLLKDENTLQYPFSEGASALAASTPNEDIPFSKTIVKLTELSPSEEVQLAYTSPEDDIPARDESPSPPPPTHRRESAAEAISNNALLPVEVLHVDVGAVKEAAVFATTTKEQGKRLKRPARAESFEEAVVDVRIQGRMTTRGQEGEEKVETLKDGEDGLKRGEEVETSTQQKSEERNKESVELKSNDGRNGEVRSSDEFVGGGAVKNDGLEVDVDDRECTDPVVVAGSGVGVSGSASIETNPNVAERKVEAEDDEDEEEESVSTAGDVKHPTQSSNPAFWVRRA